MRAAIYARYSSDLQSTASIEDQIRLCRERVAQESGTVVETYTDYAISGSSLKNRPGIAALMNDARSVRFDCVIAEALDRLSRDQEDIAAIFKRLRHADIRLLTLAEGEISELHVGLKGTMNALFLKDLAQKTRRGQRGRVEAGKIPGGNSYGYQVVRRLLDDGTVAAGERQIDHEQAAIVRRIFKEYAEGMAPRQIAGRLNREGVGSPRGGQWNASTINGNRERRNGILNNELYVGRILYGRQRFIKDPETAKRVSRPNPEHQWSTRDVPHLRIVEDDLWHRVQAIKKRHSSRWGNKRQSKKRVLSGLLTCGLCGGGMTISRGDRYYCSGRREKGTCKADRGIAAPKLEGRVLAGLKDLLLDKQDMIDEFAAEFKRELARLQKDRQGNDRRLSKDLKQVERGIKRCLDFITGGEGDPGSVRDKLRELEERRREITSEHQSRRSDMGVEIHPNLPDVYRRKVANLQQVLDDETTRPQAIATIRSLIDRIEVSPGVSRGQCDVVVVGALAQVLAFGQDHTSAPSTRRHDGTYLMVAGTRNCHYLLFNATGLPLARLGSGHSMASR